MATVTLKNIPDDIFRAIKDEAKANQRSLNSEIIFALRLYLLRTKDRPNQEEVLDRIRQFRASVKGSVSLPEIDAAKLKG